MRATGSASPIMFAMHTGDGSPWRGQHDWSPADACRSSGRLVVGDGLAMMVRIGQAYEHTNRFHLLNTKATEHAINRQRLMSRVVKQAQPQ
jgi:hypothetical protein